MVYNFIIKLKCDVVNFVSDSVRSRAPTATAELPQDWDPRCLPVGSGEGEKKLPDSTHDLGTTAKNPMELLLCLPDEEDKS